MQNKRKIQEEITSKRLEIDKEKLKLQQLKKKSVRDLWLLGGTSSGAVQKEQKVQDVTQQTKALQSSIHRIEKEIEALEREELKISTNEGVILNRLKVIEKSTEDIIKAANEKFKSEPKHFHSGIPDVQKSYTPFNMRKQSNVALGTKTDQQKPALFAMEINVQKDLCTGESRVLSTSTVPAQESQKHGIKVYDDGRKSVYALHSALDQPKADEVDELSPKEVEDLLRQARARRKKLQKQNEPLCFEDYQNSHCSQLYNMNMCDWPELEHTFSSLHYPYQEIHEPVHMLHHYREQHKYYHNSKAKSFEMDEDEIRNDSVQTYNPQEQHKRTRSQLGGSVMNRIPDLSREDPKLTGLNNLPSNNPVTMIFMGYQNAEEDAQGCDHSIQAELVIIKDEEEEEEALTSASAFKNRYIHTPMNGNTNNMSTHLTTEEMFPASMNSQAV